MLSLLYLHGLSTGDFVPALRQVLGLTAGLSAPVITTLTKTWRVGRTTAVVIACSAGSTASRDELCAARDALVANSYFPPGKVGYPVRITPQFLQAVADLRDVARRYADDPAVVSDGDDIERLLRRPAVALPDITQATTEIDRVCSDDNPASPDG